MSHATSHTTFERLSDRIEAGTERLFRDAEADETGDSLSAAAAELWDVVKEFEDLLETVDFDELPDVVDPSALSDLFDLGKLPDALQEHDPGGALDLGGLRRAVELRELWNAVDLLAFRKELGQLREELEDVVGPEVLDSDGLASAGDSEAATAVEEFIDEVKLEATNAAIQQEATEAMKQARRGVVEGHRKFEAVYESTGRGSSYARRKPVSRNPTAVSSVPSGPLPDGVSTRLSTVPRAVRGTRIDPLPRIYGRRWRGVDGSDRGDGSGRADGSDFDH